MAVGGDDDTLASSSPVVTGTGFADGTEMVAGRYRIVRWLGGGGMGQVYEALDTELDERVALKVLRGGLSEDALERFRREVRLTRRIQHRNVARMHDIGEHAGEKFLTMELVDGEPLSRAVGGTPMPWPRLRAIAEQICAGLAAAHRAGIVHRDLKPDNVLIERNTDRAVITDFGIARGGDDPGVTQVGAVVGTPRYMAPEQLAGRDLDARADLFSLGVMLFELATGTRPWSGDNAIAVAVAQATTAPRTIDTTTTQVPIAFTEIVSACLQLEPSLRPASAELVAQAIAAGSLRPDEPDEATRRKPPSRQRITTTPATGSAAPAPVMASPSPAPDRTTLAVLPLQCAPGDEYLAEGLREDVTDTLSTTPGLRVRPAAHVTATPGADPRELGRELDVHHVVVGALRRTPTGLRVAVRLIGVADGFQIWAHKTDCAEAEILSVSEQVAKGIAGALSTRATSATRPTDPRAVELYLRARAEMRRFWGTHVNVAADLLEQAVGYAPDSAPIVAAHALASVQAWVLTATPELAGRARRTIERALPTGHGEAHLASAVYWLSQGDFERAGTDLGLALLRAPMSAFAHELAAKILVEVEGLAVARQHLETAAGLDPGRSMLVSAELGRIAALEGNWPVADAQVAALQADPDPSIRQLGAVYEARFASWRGRKQEILAGASKFVPRMGDNASRLVHFLSEAAKGGTLEPGAWQRFMLAFSGTDRPLRQQLMGLQIISEIALVVGKEDEALQSLDHAAKLGIMDLIWLDHCPLLRTIADRDEFRAIRAQVAARAARVLTAFRSVTAS